jgi:hypothetical protein
MASDWLPQEDVARIHDLRPVLAKWVQEFDQQFEEGVTH